MVAKIDFTVELKDLEGRALRWGDMRDQFMQLLAAAAERQLISTDQLKKLGEFIGAEQETPVLTLERVSVTSLLSPVKDELPEDRFKTFEVMQKIHGRKRPVKLDEADIQVIKKAIGASSFIKLVMGQCWNLLSGRDRFEFAADEEEPAAEEPDAEDPTINQPTTDPALDQPASSGG
jgi:hypothetical protein